MLAGSNIVQERSAAGHRSRATAVGRRSSNLPTAGAAAANGKASCSGRRPLYLAGCRLFGRLVYWLSRKVERDVQRHLLKMRERLEIRRRSQRLSKPGPDAGPRTHSPAPREPAFSSLRPSSALRYVACVNQGILRLPNLVPRPASRQGCFLR